VSEGVWKSAVGAERESGAKDSAAKIGESDEKEETRKGEGRKRTEGAGDAGTRRRSR
jgi:hypothetical protein